MCLNRAQQKTIDQLCEHKKRERKTWQQLADDIGISYSSITKIPGHHKKPGEGLGKIAVYQE